MVKTTYHLKCSFVINDKSLKHFTLAENCVRKFFVLMKFVINIKNNLCIPSKTCKTLFSYSSWVVEIFQQFKHLENCANFFYFFHSAMVWNYLVDWKIRSFWKTNKLFVYSYSVKRILFLKKCFFSMALLGFIAVIFHEKGVFLLNVI